MLLPRSIALTVDKIAKDAIGRDWDLYATLLKNWGEIVGPDYAQDTTPVKISFPKGKTGTDKWAQGRRTDGILTIKLPQGLALDFSYRTEQIKERIACFFGYAAIERIAFEPFYGSKKTKTEGKTHPKADQATIAKLRDDLKDIENKEIRDSLERLGESILAKQSPT